MESARMESEYAGGVLNIRLYGEIDHHSAPGVREQMDRDIWFFRPSTVILTLDGVEFMDSSGLGLILGRYTRVRDLMGNMKIENPSPQIEKILRLAGVDKLIQVFHTEKPAKKPKTNKQREEVKKL